VVTANRALQLVQELGLEPHPEGGWYREIFRASETVIPADGRGERAAMSVIYYALAEAQISRWHSVRADEQWTLLDGDALELTVLDPATFRAAPFRLERGGHATTVVPGGAWQTARPLGAFALVACTVGPGFDFADFRFMADDAQARERLRRESPALARFL